MRYKGRLQDEQQFEDIIIRATPDGQILRLKDVADVELGRLSYGFHATVNGHIGVAALVFQSPGSNATEVVNNIVTELNRFQKEAPEGLKISYTLNVNDFLFASIHEVIKDTHRGIRARVPRCVYIPPGFPFNTDSYDCHPCGFDRHILPPLTYSGSPSTFSPFQLSCLRLRLWSTTP